MSDPNASPSPLTYTDFEPHEQMKLLIADYQAWVINQYQPQDRIVDHAQLFGERIMSREVTNNDIRFVFLALLQYQLEPSETYILEVFGQVYRSFINRDLLRQQIGAFLRLVWWSQAARMRSGLNQEELNAALGIDTEKSWSLMFSPTKALVYRAAQPGSNVKADAPRGWWSTAPMHPGDVFGELMAVIDNSPSKVRARRGDYEVRWEGQTQPSAGTAFFTQLTQYVIEHVAACALGESGAFKDGVWCATLPFSYGYLQHHGRSFQYIVFLRSYGDSVKPLVVYWEAATSQLVVVADVRVLANEAAADYLCQFGLVLTVILQQSCV